jgi:mannose-6-phosphate isomerase-like protein (cupin superfamily)
MMTHPLDGWNMVRAADTDWMPWGANGDARAKVLGSADGYTVALVEAQAGYQGTPHEHAYTEFFYLIDGHIRNQGLDLKSGDGYAAAAGSMHTDFEALSPATYLSIFKV